MTDPTTPNPRLYNVPFTTDTFNGMPYQLLGQSGLRASNIGLGTWKFGFPETGDGARVNEATAYAIFDKALELGVTFWDTANRYNDASGNSERLIGNWFERNAEQRRNIVLATKAFGGMDGTSPNHSRLSRGNILDSVYASLDRLRCDHVDLLYFHSYEPFTPVEESLGAVEDLVRQDLVRYFGVSNFSVDHLTLYRAAERSLSIRCRIVAVQNNFDILHGEKEGSCGVLDFCHRKGISLIPYGPLARGLLTDRYLGGKAGKGDRLVDEGILEAMSEGVTDKLQRLAKLARKWELPVSQLALAYTLTLPGMGPLIPGASTLEQLESNAAAGKLVLSPEQRAHVKAALDA